MAAECGRFCNGCEYYETCSSVARADISPEGTIAMAQEIRSARTLAEAPPGFFGVREAGTGQPLHIAADAVASYGPEEWDRGGEADRFVGCPIRLKGDDYDQVIVVTIRLRAVADAIADAMRRAKQ